ncbi:MAG: Amidohydrolase 3 [Thermomicrobiales bacterium]|nr:Amidohydrolase 3 [Thermomicrobiales bacterium]
MPVHPDLIVWGASVRTLDPELPRCSALAVKNGVILASGDDDTIRAMRGPGTRVIDARGIAFVPGLTDSHIHPLMGTLRTRGADLFDAGSLDEIRSRLARERERVGPENWVQGWGLHYEPFEESGIRGELFDDAVAGQPMLLEFFDGHTALANQTALDRAGITGPVSFAEEASIVCVDDHPTGELQEWAAVRLVQNVVPEADAETRYGWFRESFRRFNEVGLTAIHAMDGTPEELDIYRRLEENGDLTCRVIVPLWQQPDTTFADMRAQLSCRDERGRLWRCGAAKFFMDGVVETGTAWLVEPDSKGQGLHPFWRADNSDEWAARLGPARTANAFRAQTLRSSGAILALGSDWMVAPFDPRIGMAWARLRRAPRHLEMPSRAGEQALTALQTLEGYTTGAARTVSEETVSGRIKPGYRADLTGFAADPVATDADALLDLPILMTIVDGRVVHEAR